MDRKVPRAERETLPLVVDGRDRIVWVVGHSVAEDFRAGPDGLRRIARRVHDHARIAQGRYPLSTQFGERYVSIGFTSGVQHPLPGFLLMGTGHRSAILVHPGHPPNLYLSSIGCFNPTKPLTAEQMMDFTESRARVIALLDSLKAHDPDAFESEDDTPIEKAAMVVDGEPMGPVPAGSV